MDLDLDPDQGRAQGFMGLPQADRQEDRIKDPGVHHLLAITVNKSQGWLTRGMLWSNAENLAAPELHNGSAFVFA